MLGHSDLASAYEMAVATHFTEFLAGTRRVPGSLRIGDPKKSEPDLISTSMKLSVGIEIASAYYSDDAARRTWDLARGKEGAIAQLGQIQGIFVPGGSLEAQLANHINTVLRDHWHPYSVPTYLVVDIAHVPLTDSGDVAQLGDGIVLPDGSPFLGVFLRLTDRSTGKPMFLEMKRLAEGKVPNNE